MSGVCMGSRGRGKGQGMREFRIFVKYKVCAPERFAPPPVARCRGQVERASVYGVLTGLYGRWLTGLLSVNSR